MSKAPAFQFYAGDWLSSPNIALMSPSEEGAYIRLLAYAWSNEDCGLPDDDAQLARLSRLGDEGWSKGGSIIRKNFISRDGRLFNKRLLDERKKQEDWRKKSALGGKASAKSRLKGGSRVVQPKGNSPSSSPSTTPVKKKKEEKRVAAKAAPAPSKINREFFEKGEVYTKAVEHLIKVFSASETDLVAELDNFIRYWTEKNKSGTKCKWELRETFELKLRLATWFNNKEKWGKPSTNLTPTYDVD